MPRINCSVENCSYNQGKYCCASVVKIEGRSANVTEETCCSTFLDDMGYNQSNNILTNLVDVDAILCNVNTCVYNECEHCTLHDIEVSSLNATEVFTQTDCLSFDRKSTL